MLQRHLVRLACIRHAASVHPEPGSNSPPKFHSRRSVKVGVFTGIDRACVASYHFSVVKVLSVSGPGASPRLLAGLSPRPFRLASSFQTKIPMHLPHRLVRLLDPATGPRL